MLCEVQPRNQLWFYPWNSLLRLSLCSCFQRGSICCIRNTSSNSHLSAFKAALSPLKKMFKKPLPPSYFLLHWVPTKQLELYVSFLKVPGRALEFRWSEGPWLLSLMVVMLPGPSMAEEQEMTESHNFPADAQIQGTGALDIHLAVDTEDEHFPGRISWVKGNHKMLLWGL